MNYIPSIRTRNIPFLYENTEDSQKKETKRNTYWQGYLNDQNSEFLKGFDQCAEQTVSSFFCNLEIYKKELVKAFGIEVNSDEDVTDVDMNIILSEKSISNGEYSKEELALMNKYTKLFKVMKECMICHIDIERDVLGASMIDNMNKNEYQKIKEEVDAGKRHTYYTDIDPK